MKRFAAAAVLLTMGLFLTGCENKATAPTPAASPAAKAPLMGSPEDAKSSEPAAATEEKKEPAAAEEAKAPEATTPAATEEKPAEEPAKKDGE